MVYTQEQVDRIVAEEVQKAVKAEIARQVDTELIDLKIDKAANEKYAHKQTAHDSWIIGIVAVLIAIVGIVLPLLRDRRIESRLKEAEKIVRKSKRQLIEIQAWGEKDFNKQIEMATQLIEDSKNKKEEAEAYYIRGIIYGNKFFYNEAIADLDNAIERGQNNANAYYNRGYYHYKNGSNGEAIRDFGISVNKNPNHAFSYKMWADVLYDEGNYDEALEKAERAKWINSNESEIYYTLYKIYNELGRQGDADESINIGKDKADKQRDAYMVQKFNDI